MSDAFVKLEKACDRKLSEVVKRALRKRMVEEWLVQAVMSKRNKTKTALKTNFGIIYWCTSGLGVKPISVCDGGFDERD